MPLSQIRQTRLFPIAGLALAGALALAACTPAGVAVGAGATAGVAAAEERGIRGAGKDTLIRVEINEAWLNSDFDTFNRLNLQIYEGRVLISGKVPNQANADEAVRLAWQADGVREVINEIEISEGGGLDDFANDALINARLDSALLFDSEIDSINYSTRSVAGTVYLLGVAQDRAELDRVFRVTRDIPNVKRVVSHVIMKDDPRRVARPASDTTGDAPGDATDAPADQPASRR
ncbi:MAG: BON domain-containing protein [Alphaproteobacteria bacterium]|nr:BON domain-containing protein [Alphaproteobacteria bacterium]